MSDHEGSSPSHGAAEPFTISAEAIAALPLESKQALTAVDNLKYFLISAPVDWQSGQYIRRFLLPTGEYVSCVLWSTLYHISGTDIVRCLAFRFSAFGRPVKNTKKFEEGIFSDLRNLKAGTDATLEEPKSPFLDFLYKNNCIRTQKKQKVFYWYSVPHDRLFLDALERDLKREKAGQEPTTVAESEPALSFVCDTSTSLYEQLTKSKNSSSSIFSTVPQSFDPPASPVMQHETSATPSVPQRMHHVAEQTINDMSSFGGSTMPMTTASAMPMMTQSAMKHDQHSQPMMYQNMPVEVNGYNQVSQRHTSVPLYYESSPAPSNYSTQSYYEQPSTRAISYEPMTPPHHQMHYTPEPACLPADAYRSYSAEPQQFHHGVQLPQSMNPHFIPTSTPQYPAKSVHPVNIMYGHIEGSPNYKRRRRSSSISPGPSAPTPAHQRSAVSKPPHATHRPSDLRRAISVTGAPAMHHQFERAVSGPPMSTDYGNQMYYTPDVSRHGSPLASIEGPDYTMSQEQFVSPASYAAPSYNSFEPSSAGGMVRRARSATASYYDDAMSPSKQKLFSCFAGCPRKFKRQEHLKRHMKTHTEEKPFECPECQKTFSRSDNLAQHRRTHEVISAGAASYSDEFDEEDLPSLAEDTSPDMPTGPSFDDKPFGDSLTLPAVDEDLMMTSASYHHVPGSMGPPPLPKGLMSFS